jgi:hypothetical protein
MALPSLNPTGYLPAGIHECELNEVELAFVNNPYRAKLWKRLREFVAWTGSMKQFDWMYLDGGFVTGKAEPDDIDVVLQPRAPYGVAALESMMPFFEFGLVKIREQYAIHLHFWCEGFPGGSLDFRLFFQYLRPQDAAPRGLPLGSTKGIIKVKIP